MTMVVVTHEMDLAERGCVQRIFMDDGQIVEKLNWKNFRQSEESGDWKEFLS